MTRRCLENTSQCLEATENVEMCGTGHLQEVETLLNDQSSRSEARLDSNWSGRGILLTVAVIRTIT